MAYATPQQMIDAFGEKELIELTDGADIGQIDLSVLARVLDRATGEIDPAVRAAGLQPGISDQLLTDIACDIARYHLYEDSDYEAVTVRYQEAQRKLRLIARRELRLAADPDNQGTAGLPDYSSPGAVFSQESLKYY